MKIRRINESGIFNTKAQTFGDPTDIGVASTAPVFNRLRDETADRYIEQLETETNSEKLADIAKTLEELADANDVDSDTLYNFDIYWKERYEACKKFLRDSNYKIERALNKYWESIGEGAFDEMARNK